MSATKKAGSLWAPLTKALVGALVLSIVAIAFIYGWVTFNTQPRLSAAASFVGVVAFIYMSVGFGKAIAALEGLRSTLAQQAVPTDRAKPRSG